MNTDEILQSAENTLSRARIAEGLINGTAWKEVFEPFLNKKIEYYKNIDNCEDLKAHKEALKALQSLRVELISYIDEGPGAQDIIDRLTKGR